MTRMKQLGAVLALALLLSASGAFGIKRACFDLDDVTPLKVYAPAPNAPATGEAVYAVPRPGLTTAGFTFQYFTLDGPVTNPSVLTSPSVVEYWQSTGISSTTFTTTASGDPVVNVFGLGSTVDWVYSNIGCENDGVYSYVPNTGSTWPPNCCSQCSHDHCYDWRYCGDGCGCVGAQASGDIPSTIYDLRLSGPSVASASGVTVTSGKCMDEAMAWDTNMTNTFCPGGMLATGGDLNFQYNGAYMTISNAATSWPAALECKKNPCQRGHRFSSGSAPVQSGQPVNSTDGTTGVLFSDLYMPGTKIYQIDGVRYVDASTAVRFCNSTGTCGLYTDPLQLSLNSSTAVACNYESIKVDPTVLALLGLDYTAEACMEQGVVHIRTKVACTFTTHPDLGTVTTTCPSQTSLSVSIPATQSFNPLLYQWSLTLCATVPSDICPTSPYAYRPSIYEVSGSAQTGYFISLGSNQIPTQFVQDVGWCYALTNTNSYLCAPNTQNGRRSVEDSILISALQGMMSGLSAAIPDEVYQSLQVSLGQDAAGRAALEYEGLRQFNTGQVTASAQAAAEVASAQAFYVADTQLAAITARLDGVAMVAETAGLKTDGISSIAAMRELGIPVLRVQSDYFYPIAIYCNITSVNSTIMCNNRTVWIYTENECYLVPSNMSLPQVIDGFSVQNGTISKTDAIFDETIAATVNGMPPASNTAVRKLYKTYQGSAVTYQSSVVVASIFKAGIKAFTLASLYGNNTSSGGGGFWSTVGSMIKSSFDTVGGWIQATATAIGHVATAIGHAFGGSTLFSSGFWTMIFYILIIVGAVWLCSALYLWFMKMRAMNSKTSPMQDSHDARAALLEPHGDNRYFNSPDKLHTMTVNPLFTTDDLPVAYTPMTKPTNGAEYGTHRSSIKQEPEEEESQPFYEVASADGQRVRAVTFSKRLDPTLVEASLDGATTAVNIDAASMEGFIAQSIPNALVYWLNNAKTAAGLMYIQLAVAGHILVTKLTPDTTSAASIGDLGNRIPFTRRQTSVVQISETPAHLLIGFTTNPSIERYPGSGSFKVCGVCINMFTLEHDDNNDFGYEDESEMARKVQTWEASKLAPSLAAAGLVRYFSYKKIAAFYTPAGMAYHLLSPQGERWTVGPGTVPRPIFPNTLTPATTGQVGWNNCGGAIAIAHLTVS